MPQTTVTLKLTHLLTVQSVLAEVSAFLTDAYDRDELSDADIALLGLVNDALNILREVR